MGMAETEKPKSKKYLQWKLDLIGIIANSKVYDGLIREEVKLICRNESCVAESFLDGNTPEDYWQNELDALNKLQSERNK